jgi:hypothetical protein
MQFIKFRSQLIKLLSQLRLPSLDVGAVSQGGGQQCLGVVGSGGGRTNQVCFWHLPTQETIRNPVVLGHN